MWYLSNTFKIDGFDCDATLLAKLYQHMNTLGQKIANHPIGSLSCQGINWANLEKWCYNVWDRKCFSIDVEEVNDDEDDGVIDAAMKIAKTSRGLPWTDCKAMLTLLRRVAGHADAEWLL